MNEALTIADQFNYSWMLYLDADEFLNLNRFSNVKDFLNTFKFADAIGINWLMFGTSQHKKQPKGLITENFVNSELRLNQHVKSFVRPHCAIKSVNPHFFIISDKNRYYSANGTKMAMGPFNNQPLCCIKSTAYVAHYYTQSEEEHFRRKSRTLDDGSINKEKDYIENIHNIHNNFPNHQLKIKYSENIKTLLHKNGIIL
jgi:hypothetical protein